MDKCPVCKSALTYTQGHYYCEGAYCDWVGPDKGNCLLEVKDAIQKALELYPELKQAIQLTVERL
jgi:hypothetical protein